MILDDRGIPRGVWRITRFTLFPGHGLEQMIAANFYIGGIDFGFGAAKKNALPGGLKEVVVNLERADGNVSVAAADGGGVRARAAARYAMKAAEIGIDHRDEVGAVDHSDAFVHFLVVRRMHPVAVENYVVRALGRDQPGDAGAWLRGPLDADEAIVISERGSGGHFDKQSRHQLGRSAGRLGVSRPSRQ